MKTPPPTLAVIGFLIACGPPAVWTGTTPTGLGSFRVDGEDGQACVEVHTIPLGCFDGVDLASFVFSEDGARFAFPAQVGERWTVVRDGVEGPYVDGVADLTMTRTGDHLAYAALRDGGWHVVLDGDFGDAYDELLGGSLVFDPAGRRLAYGGRRGTDTYVVVDGREVGPYDGVGSIRFSPGGDRAAFVVRRDGRAELVVDARRVAEHVSIEHFEFAESGEGYAYTFWNEGGWWVGGSHTDAPQGPYRAIRAFRFPHGRPGPAFVASDDGGERMIVGSPGPRFDAIVSPAFDTAGVAWGYIGRDSTSSSLVLSGNIERTEASMSELTMRADGRRYAYVSHRDEGTFVVHDRGDRRFDLVVPGTLLFLDEHDRWACLVGHIRDETLYVVVEDIAEGRRVGWSSIMDITTGFSPHDDSGYDAAIRAWVAKQAREILEGAEPVG